VKSSIRGCWIKRLGPLVQILDFGPTNVGFLANPTLAELAAAVDRRTTGAYASVYAIYNVAYAVGTIGSDVATAALASVFTFGTTLSGMSVALLASLVLMHHARRTGVKRIDESP
jgi:hypothetical protein